MLPGALQHSRVQLQDPHGLRELGVRLHKVDGQLRVIGIRAWILVVRTERPRVIPLTCALHHVRAAAVTMRKVTAPLRALIDFFSAC